MLLQFSVAGVNTEVEEQIACTTCEAAFLLSQKSCMHSLISISEVALLALRTPDCVCETAGGPRQRLENPSSKF